MSYLEKILGAIIKSEGIEAPTPEFRFHTTRKWRFDLCWKDQKLAVEIMGGIWNRGAHTRGAHYLSDCEKMNTATLMGYRVLNVCREHIESGQAILWIKEGLGMENNA